MIFSQANLVQTGDTTKNALVDSFTNAGTIILDSVVFARQAQLIVSGSMALINAATGVINVNQGTGGGRTLSLVLDNQGLATLTGTSSTLGRSGAGHINSGDIRLDNATLTIAGSTFTNTIDGTITGTGTLDVAGVGFVHNVPT